MSADETNVKGQRDLFFEVKGSDRLDPLQPIGAERSATVNRVAVCEDSVLTPRTHKVDHRPQQTPRVPADLHFASEPKVVRHCFVVLFMSGTSA